MTLKHSGMVTIGALTVGLVVAAAPPASAADVLVVGPGKVGALRMGTTVTKAVRTGWVKRDRMCRSWTAGPKSLKWTKRGEVFKAYPEKIRSRRVHSMWAAGEVVTVKGVRAEGLSSGRRGSTLTTVRQAYPRLKRLGWWAPGADWGLDRVVYTVGSRKKGWLDFFIDRDTRRVTFVLVRSDRISWKAFKGADGC